MGAIHQLKNIAVVGASGNVGASLLKHLLQAPPDRFRITAISRAGSSAVFPSHASLTVKRGSYSDPAFLSTAFKNQDAVVFVLSFMAMEAQATMIEAAANAGVKWILPTEYAGDGNNKEMVDVVPYFRPKSLARKQIEELSKQPSGEGLKWVGVATNPWLEMSVTMGLFGVSPSARTATLYPDSGSFNTSTIDLVGLGMARLLSLPIENPDRPRASLAHYGNNFAYLSSFLATQTRVLEAIQRVTNTTDTDWTIDRSKTISQWIVDSREAMNKGNMMAGLGLAFAMYMGEGMGGNFESKAKEDRAVLDLPHEDLDEAVSKAIAGEGASMKFYPKAR